MGKCITIAEFGETAQMWIVAQLADLAVFCGSKEKLNELQQHQLASIIINEYYYLKLTEFMLFCYKFKRGDYGRFYGSTDPLVITTALLDFIKYRNNMLHSLESKKHEEVRDTYKMNAYTSIDYIKNKEQIMQEYKRLHNIHN